MGIHKITEMKEQRGRKKDPLKTHQTNIKK